MEIMQTLSAGERWRQLRAAAGFESDRELERRAGITAGSIWFWTVGRNGIPREPNVTSLRALKTLLNTTLDVLDELILSMRAEH